jgi:hypothetical protein
VAGSDKRSKQIAPHENEDHADRIRAKIVEIRKDLATARKDRAYTAVSTQNRLELLAIKELNAIEAGRDNTDPYADLDPEEIAALLVEELRKLPAHVRSKALGEFAGPRLVASEGGR